MEKRLRLANNFALKKCTRRVCTPEDLISQLPDEILVYILSFLSLKEAADTSVISRRWLSLWTYIPRLDFDAAKPLDEVARKSKLRKMHRRKQVQRLELDLSRRGHDTQYSDNCYSFPAQLLNLGDFARLNDPDKLPSFWNNFKSVKVLLLKSVDVTGEALEFFLHNCPFLEQMVVHGSRSLVNLEVVGPSLMLKHLEIWWCLKVKSLKICDTNLVRLGTSAGDKLLLSNVPMLIEVDILGCPLRRILDEILFWFSCVLSQLEVLKIHTTNGLEYFKNYKFPKLTKLKKFVLVVDAREEMSLLGCTDVIRASPQLKEFELQVVDQIVNHARVQGVKRCAPATCHLKRDLKCIFGGSDTYPTGFLESLSNIAFNCFLSRLKAEADCLDNPGKCMSNCAERCVPPPANTAEFKSSCVVSCALKQCENYISVSSRKIDVADNPTADCFKLAFHADDKDLRRCMSGYCEEHCAAKAAAATT